MSRDTVRLPIETVSRTHHLYESRSCCFRAILHLFAPRELNERLPGLFSARPPITVPNMCFNSVLINWRTNISKPKEWLLSGVGFRFLVYLLIDHPDTHLTFAWCHCEPELVSGEAISSDCHSCAPKRFSAQARGFTFRNDYFISAFTIEE